uniref:peptide-methionine (R)-S-oxide reductase n=1 Tax=Biomphalaria glabrata TaxID=6526 RepID=A0A2C9LGH9_BIOGL
MKAWSGELLENKAKGIYSCTCCGTALFKIQTQKPWQFFDVLKDKDVSELPAVDFKTDTSHGMVRTEVLCGK